MTNPPFILPAFQNLMAPGQRPDVQQQVMQGSTPQPERGPGIFDRVFGTTDIRASEREPARDAGLLSAGLSLLKSSGPTTEPQSFLGNLAGAIEAGRGAAVGSLARNTALASRRVLQDAMENKEEGVPLDLVKVYEEMLSTGDLAGAKTVSEMIASQGGSSNLIQVRAGNRVELRNPVTGALVHTVDIATDPDKMVTETLAMLGQFRSQTKESAAMADNFRKMQVNASGTPAADVALVFAFMKMIDPTSTVRESEQAQARNAAGIPTRIRAWYNNALKGTTLEDETRLDLLNQARGMAAAQQTSFEIVRQDFGRLAEAFELDPEDVTIDFFEGFKFTDEDRAMGQDAPPGPAELELSEILEEEDMQAILDAARKVSGNK